MAYLGNLPNTIFMGQGVGVPGTTMSQTLRSVPAEKLEMPVAEELQMGMAIGMSLGGYLPICIFPRWNFMLRAADQLVNHLDRLPLFSKYRPKVIIRTAVPSSSPFDPGPQHDDDFSLAFRSMFRTIEVLAVKDPQYIMPAYRAAVGGSVSTVIVEYTEFYKDARARE
jgi:pyruvate/2-oxoglutarate/acetoin dehydrogenase E1 component